ncbi:MAG: triphosphoribosyl-dephospho-CoA synthase MdcB [Casimicrobiaceae bacterium]
MNPRPLAAHVAETVPRTGAAGDAQRIGRHAVLALYHEAALYPKPGLVSALDSGAHADMTMATFYRSLFALRGYFPAIATLGTAGAPLAELQKTGIAAEAAMLRATRGVNTHRGAIFNLGLLCAATGALTAAGRPVTARAVCAQVRAAYGAEIRRALALALPVSHGLTVARMFGAGGARAEAAAGFPSVRSWSLPAYRVTFAVTGDRERASVHALFALIAHLADSNLLWRGGRDGLAWAQYQAAQFLADGGVLAPNWRDRAIAVHRAFVRRSLSPGGSADLLAVTLFLDALDHGTCHAR